MSPNDEYKARLKADRELLNKKDEPGCKNCRKRIAQETFNMVAGGSQYLPTNEPLPGYFKTVEELCYPNHSNIDTSHLENAIDRLYGRKMPEYKPVDVIDVMYGRTITEVQKTEENILTNADVQKNESIQFTKIPGFSIRIYLPRYIKVGNCMYDLYNKHDARKFTASVYQKRQYDENRIPEESSTNYNMENLKSQGQYKYIEIYTSQDTTLFFRITINGPCDNCCTSLLSYSTPNYIINYAISFFYQQPDNPNEGNIYFGNYQFKMPETIIANSDYCKECSRKPIDISNKENDNYSVKID